MYIPWRTVITQFYGGNIQYCCFLVNVKSGSSGTKLVIEEHSVYQNEKIKRENIYYVST